MLGSALEIGCSEASLLTTLRTVDQELAVLQAVAAPMILISSVWLEVVLK